jgi:hypothetical protein
MANITQSTQFKILELSIITEFGAYDISGIMEELNLFDNVFAPCMSGNIIVKDALNIFSKLKLDGNEYINVSINKDSEDGNPSSIYNFRKQYRIYKVSNVKNSNLSSKTYVLHFVSEEFVLSQQIKLNQSYSGTYSEIVTSVLKDTLLIDEYSYFKYRNTLENYKQGIIYIHPTNKYMNIVAPNINPIKFIDLICKKAVSNDKADFVFYENQWGYNFDSISRMMTMPTQFMDDESQYIPFKVMPKNTEYGDPFSEMFGIRDIKIINNTNVPEMIKSGTFVGKFVGFDTLTRKVSTEVISSDTLNPIQNKNKKTELNNVNSLKKRPTEMEDSRVVTYPFMTTRADESWIVENNKRISDYSDNTEQYVFQRTSYLKQITQQRLKLTMAGNFGLYSGSNIFVEVPKFSIKDDEADGLDETLNGKYLIVAARHIIRYDKHETVVEVITDSYGGAA